MNPQGRMVGQETVPLMNAYDIVSIGGGLAGASLAKVTAERGARVLILERETRFKDRVPGEALFPWGAAELETLGLRTLPLSTCAPENRWWDDFLAPTGSGIAIPPRIRRAAGRR